MSFSVGDVVPDFTLATDGEGEVVLSSLQGKYVILYFYPKDDTPGCTQESKDFRDAFAGFVDKDAVVLGISKDGVESHDKFKNKYDLPFNLLADVVGDVCESYGVWKEKSMYGKKYMGIERSTFLIGKDGKLLREWRKVKVGGHVDEVLAEIA